MYSAEQSKLISQLLASMSAEETVARRDNTDFSEAFLNHVKETDVDFYLDRLLTVANRVELNRREKEKQEAWELKERQDSVDAAVFELMARVREYLPTKSSMDLEMTPKKTRLDLYVGGYHAKTVIFDKERMGLSGSLRGVQEDVSGWDKDMLGWDQSEIMRQFVAYVEGHQEKEEGTGC